jgi:hypothetical protein
LLAVAQGGVEDNDAVLVGLGLGGHGISPWISYAGFVSFSRGRTQNRIPLLLAALATP